MPSTSEHASYHDRNGIGRCGAALLQEPRAFEVNGAAAEVSLRLELSHAFKKNVANDGKAFRADFVERILGGVPVRNFEVNYINGRNVALEEGIVVILDLGSVLNEYPGITESCRCGPDQVGE